MIIGDLLLERRIPDDTLSTAFSRVLGIPIDDVLFVRNMDEWKPLAGATLELFDRSGEFPLQVCVHVLAQHQISLRELAKKASHALGSRILISSDDPNPYAMILFTPDAEPIDVFVDVESLDEHEQFKIDRERTAEDDND